MFIPVNDKWLFEQSEILTKQHQYIFLILKVGYYSGMSLLKEKATGCTSMLLYFTLQDTCHGCTRTPVMWPGEDPTRGGRALTQIPQMSSFKPKPPVEWPSNPLQVTLRAGRSSSSLCSRTSPPFPGTWWVSSHWFLQNALPRRFVSHRIGTFGFPSKCSCVDLNEYKQRNYLDNTNGFVSYYHSARIVLFLSNNDRDGFTTGTLLHNGIKIFHPLRNHCLLGSGK